MANVQRSVVAKKFADKYSELSDTRKNNFSKLCNKLLNDNFVYGQKDEDRNDYYEILVLKEIINDYFYLIDYNLIHNDTYKIFYIQTSAGRNRRHLKKLESVISLILRLLYHKGICDVNSSSDIECTCEELILEVNKTGIYKDSPTAREYLEALKTLKKYKMIDFDFREFKEENRLTIYPTIQFVVTIETIDMILEKLKTYQIAKGVDDETEED